MFTGIIETTGTVAEVRKDGHALHFLIDSDISNELRPDQSVAHEGVCLTVTECNEQAHWVTAVEETLKKTNLSHWKPGQAVNLERALKLGDRLDGHLVQGHVDTIAQCIERKKAGHDNDLFRIRFDARFAPLMIEKGSVCMNGVSLTAFNVTEDTFTVTVIPHTLSHTSLDSLHPGSLVNIEFDLLGKYLLRQKEVYPNR